MLTTTKHVTLHLTLANIKRYRITFISYRIIFCDILYIFLHGMQMYPSKSYLSTYYVELGSIMFHHVILCCIMLYYVVLRVIDRLFITVVDPRFYRPTAPWE